MISSVGRLTRAGRLLLAASVLFFSTQLLGCAPVPPVGTRAVEAPTTQPPQAGPGPHWPPSLPNPVISGPLQARSFADLVEERGNPVAFAISPDGSRMALSFQGNPQDKEPAVVLLYDPIENKRVKLIELGGVEYISDLEFTLDGKSLLGLTDIGLIFWDSHEGGESRRIPELQGYQILVSPKGGEIAVQTGRGLESVTLDGEAPRTLVKASDFKAESVAAYSPDGQLIAYNQATETSPEGPTGILLVESSSGKVVRTLGDDPGPVAFSSDGRLLASLTLAQSGQSQMRIWEVASGKKLHEWSRANYPADSMLYYPVLRFMPASSSLVASVDGNRLELTNIETGEVVAKAIGELWLVIGPKAEIFTRLGLESPQHAIPVSYTFSGR